MAKTLAEVLAGEDMEGGEVFCDDVYNFLKNQGKDLNLLTNSGFGVWSQSDTNKGLATLTFDSGSVEPVVGETLTGATSGAVGKVITVTVTGGTWGGGNAAGTIELGAVSGCYQDNETVNGSVGGVNILTVNGDQSTGVANDPMNNDSTGIWTDDGVNITLAFAAAEYTVTTNAATQRAWIAGVSLEAGKLYKIELDIKDGTAAVQDIEGYFDDGAAQYGKIETTAAGWASVFWTFECATTTAAGKVGFRIPTSLGGNNIEIRRFSCYEITPGCTAADNLAFDCWYKDSTIDIYRQHSDGGTLTKDGSFYSLKMVVTAVADYMIFPNLTVAAQEEWYQEFAGRTITFGAWVKTSTASHAYLRIYDGNNSDSDYHTGGGDWEWIEVTRTISSSTTEVRIMIATAAAPNVDGSTIVYISQPMLVFGSSIGEDMYQPKQQEVIWLDYRIPSNLFTNLLNQSSTGAWTDLNVEADSDAMLPKGCKAIRVLTAVRDLGSAGAACAFSLMKDSTFSVTQYSNYLMGLTNDSTNILSSWQPCGPEGDVQYDITATGAGTFDILYLRYMGVRVN